MKILYISPQHISGTLPLFCEAHKKRGNEAIYLTLFPSKYGFPEDLELRLPFHPDKTWISNTRLWMNKIRGITPQTEAEGNPPFWQPGGLIASLFFKFRDSLIEKRVYDFFDEHKLWDFDLLHLEQGLDIFRGCRLSLKLKEMGKKFACFYHGNDVRNRGVIPAIHRISDLNLSSELDLLDKYPGMKYLFLPIDTDLIKPVPRNNEKIRIAHATRDRTNKGTDYIIQSVMELSVKHPVELVLIENQPHDICMKIKSTCDIYIDQIADMGGWGYGMSSVESLAQGIPTCTYLNERYLEFIPDHPFINVNYDNFESKLTELIRDIGLRDEMSARGREWVVRNHDINSVADELYKYYEEAGII